MSDIAHLQPLRVPTGWRVKRIRRSIALVVLALLPLAGCAVRPAPDSAHAPTSARLQVLAVEDSMYAALVARDTAALSRHLAAEFVLGGSAESLETREQYLVTALMPGRSLRPIVLTDRTVRIYGTTAVSMGRAALEGELRGRPIALRFRYTNLYVLREGRWQAVASHLSVID